MGSDTITTMQRRQFALLALVSFALGLSPAAHAQTYPARPIRLIVPFPAAGATDLFARTLSQKMGERLGATLVIDNKPGAGGAIGSDLAAKAAPDGYTLLLATTSTHSIGPAISAKLPYDTVHDFTPIGHVGDAPSIMLVPMSSPAKTVREWIDYAKKNPGKLNYASSGNGTIVQLTAELFKSQAGVFVTHIPYKGTALAIPDLMSGKVDVLFDSLPTGLPFVRDGRLRALGVTSLKRSPLAPDVPTMSEAGVPGLDVDSWLGIFAPAKTPPEVIAKLRRDIRASLPELKERFEKSGGEVWDLPDDKLDAFVASEYESWTKLIREAGIKLD